MKKKHSELASVPAWSFRRRKPALWWRPPILETNILAIADAGSSGYVGERIWGRYGGSRGDHSSDAKFRYSVVHHATMVRPAGDAVYV